MTSEPQLECAGATDVGRKRELNEDQFLVAQLHKSILVEKTSLAIEDRTTFNGTRKGWLLAVADGMGGAPAGDRASSIAVSELVRFMLESLPLFIRLDGREAELSRALVQAQSGIEGDVKAHPELRGMGTTMTMAYVVWPRAYIVHVGDSRCYRMRGGKLEQVTRDHSLAQKLQDEGVLDAEQARRSRWSSVIWNVIGGATPDLQPDVIPVDLAPGDALLLCTDGVTRHVRDDGIAEALSRASSAEDAAKRLIEAGLAGGGSDNLTAVVARVPAA